MELKNKKIILASASPRRKKLISYLGADFSVCPADVSEESIETNPSKFVSVLSKRKAQFVYEKFASIENIIVIGADTVVAYKDDIFGKPVDEKEAFDMLCLLSDRTHQVYTGVTVIANDDGKTKQTTFCEKTDVVFCKISSSDIKEYIKTKEPMDKAGAYGIQGQFSKYIRAINGDYNNVVGLPICTLYQKILIL